jgi:mono/diheme cytochrome c family protein
MWMTRAPDGTVFSPPFRRSGRVPAPARAGITVFLSALFFWGFTVTSTVAIRAQDASVEAGRIAYLRECAGCHGVSALGDGPDAPFLASAPTNLRLGVLDMYDDEALQARIREGKSLALELRPEALSRHAQESEAVYEFLIRMPGVVWEKTEAGQDLYLLRCVACHDRYGHPVAQPMKGVRKGARDLADPTFQRAVTDEELHVLARHGKAAMPALVPRLREDEVGPLVSFIRLLSPGYETYSRYCERCHGTQGRGASGLVAELGTPDFAFDRDYFAARDEEQVRAAIWHMLRDAKPQMPHFAASLSVAEVDSILGYLRSLPALRPTQTH